MTALGMLFLPIYWDYKTRQKKYRWARILATLIAIVSLIALFTKPALLQEHTDSKLAIVTEGASA
ncbi:MAG: hypothetical protein RIF34_05480, partial [Candidatus Kapaibacterium sp.]